MLKSCGRATPVMIPAKINNEREAVWGVKGRTPARQPPPTLDRVGRGATSRRTKLLGILLPSIVDALCTIKREGEKKKNLDRLVWKKFKKKQKNI